VPSSTAIISIIIADAAVKIVGEQGITFVTGPAAVTGDLVAAAARAEVALPSLTALGGGGAPRPPEQVCAIAAHFPTAEPNIGWGMTETNAIGSGHAGASYRERPTSSGLGSQLLDFRLVGEDGEGVLLTGDTAAGTPDEHWVSFMRSFPNKVPLSAAVVRRVADRVLALDFDRLYDNFGGQVLADAHTWVARSADRYIGWVRGDFDHLTEP
jgi:hypothetical protein